MRGTTKSRIAGIFSLLVVFAVGGCSGYQLKIDEAEVLSQDDTSITYRVTVKNAPPGGFGCRAKSFHGDFAVSALFMDAPTRAESNLVKGAGGFSAGYMIEDPTATDSNRTVGVGVAHSQDFTCRKDPAFDYDATPFLQFKLRSKAANAVTYKGGTSGCTRHGNVKVVDLR